jgi:hypothetical protein
MTIAHIGFGTTIAFESGFFAQIVGEIKRSGPTREVIDGTHSASPNNRTEKVPSDLIDEGEYDIEILFDGSQEPPIDEDPSACVVTWKTPRGMSVGATDSFSAFLTSAPVTAPITGNTPMKMQCKLVVTGLVTHTDPS